jgi:hypothetical protein
MIKNIIKVTNKDNIEFFLKKSDIAKKYNYTAQYIGEILNGKTKKNYIIHDNEIYNLEYISDEEIIKKYACKKEKKNMKNIENNDNDNNKKQEKKKEPFDYFSDFLNESTNKTNNKEDYIKLTSLYDKFKCSKYFLDNNKSMKEKILTLKNMKEYFENNKETVLSYKKNFDKLVNGERIRAYKVLVGYKFKD